MGNKLSDFDINFTPARAIKGKALADFVVELTYKIGKAHEDIWTIFVDNTTSQSNNGTGAVLFSQTEQRIEHVFNFEFAMKNNEVEYEAFTSGIIIADTVGAMNIKIYTDS